jgi:hypothetical protein
MFEQLEEEEKGKKQERKKVVQMTTYIVAALVVVIVIVYLVAGRQAKAPPPVKSPVVSSKPAPDPAHDLRLIHAVMGKDAWGIRVRWSVQVRNNSKVYTYRDIQYDAYFLAPDGVRLGEEHNTIKDSIGPGEEKTFPEFAGGNYDARASTYQFVIVGATVAAQ